MQRGIIVIGVAAMLLGAGIASAQPMDAMVAPLPADAPMDRITPPEGNDSDALLTTRPSAPASQNKTEAPLPWEKAEPAQSAAPAPNNAAPFAAPAASQSPPQTPFGTYQPKIPFGRGESHGPAVPSGPHSTVAVPVVEVDEVEAATPQAPTPVDPAADPAQADPAEPTELTSPIFSPDASPYLPRKITLRALNKVTAQSERIDLKMNETVRFGQLEITALTCRISDATSQNDSAALLDIRERLATKEGKKLLFRGWMYASSPSVTSLEHPVYDVSMVDCRMGAVAPKPAANAPAKPDTAGDVAKTPAKKAKN